MQWKEAGNLFCAVKMDVWSREQESQAWEESGFEWEVGRVLTRRQWFRGIGAGRRASRWLSQRQRAQAARAAPECRGGGWGAAGPQVPRLPLSLCPRNPTGPWAVAGDGCRSGFPVTRAQPSESHLGVALLKEMERSLLSWCVFYALLLLLRGDLDSENPGHSHAGEVEGREREVRLLEAFMGPLACGVASLAGLWARGLWRVYWLLKAELSELSHIRAQRGACVLSRGQGVRCPPTAVALNFPDKKLRPDS